MAQAKRVTALVRLFVDPWLGNVWMDWLLAVILAGAAAYYRAGELVAVGDKSGLYQAMAAAALGFLSLGTVAVTLIVTVTPTKQLSAALAKDGRELIETIFSCLWGLMAGTLVFAALYALDHQNAAIIRLPLFVAAGCLTALSGARVLWLLQLTLRLLL